MKKQLTLAVSDDTEFTFTVTTSAYNNLVNASQKNLSGSAIQFLQATITPEQRDDFNQFIDENPAAPQQFVELLISAFAPKVAVILKN